MKLTIVKQLNNSFKVAYDSDYEKLKKIKVGDLLECEIKKPRNYMFHKKYFALLNLVFQNQEIYANIDDLRNDITIEAGFFTLRENIKGDVIKQAHSISFASMDKYKFEEYYSKCLYVIVKYFNFNKELIKENIEQYF